MGAPVAQATELSEEPAALMAGGVYYASSPLSEDAANEIMRPWYDFIHGKGASDDGN